MGVVFNFFFNVCLFLPLGNHSCSTCPARLMAPVLMSFQVCSRRGFCSYSRLAPLRLSAAFGNPPPAPRRFWDTHPPLQHLSQVKPRCHPLLFPPKMTTLAHLARSRDVSVCWEGYCALTAPEHGVQQNKSPFVSRPSPGPTKGLGDAPAALVGTGEPMVGTAPHWLWRQHSTQGVLGKRDNNELLWLFLRVFPQRKPARLMKE